MYSLLDWLSEKWQAWQDWLESWQPCPKEQGGYRCQHRTYPNGTKECGTERNYWRGGDE